MNVRNFLSSAMFLLAAILAALPFGSARAEMPQGDGSHDFDFNLGVWKTHVARLEKPLSGSKHWLNYDGIATVRKIWKGRGNIFVLEADGAAGRIDGLGVRLYNPAARQWSLNWASVATGSFETPCVGNFKKGVGTFIDQEQYENRAILIRNTFSDITQNASRFEQAFSDDQGKTWETNWVMTFTRIKSSGN